VLPGSKAVQADLDWLREQGHEAAILRHLRYGGKLIGICGGFQMLGRQLHDPLADSKAHPEHRPGLGLLDCETTLEPEKQLRNVAAPVPAGLTGDFAGYEIHMGARAARPWPAPPRRSTASRTAPSARTTPSSPATATASSTHPRRSPPCSPGPAWPGRKPWISRRGAKPIWSGWRMRWKGQ
jgi:hypothetical protein